MVLFSLTGAPGVAETLRTLSTHEVVATWDWQPLWARAEGAATQAIDAAVARDGRPSLRIEHTAARDWSLYPSDRFAVKSGDLLDLSAWVKVTGEGSAETGFVLYDARDEAREWSYGAARTRHTDAWRLLESRILVPPGVTCVRPRLIGDGPATVWMSGFRLTAADNIGDRRRGLAPTLSVENDSLSVELRTEDATLAVTDKRTGQVWTQMPVATDLAVTDVKPMGRRGWRLALLHVATGQSLAADVQLDERAPEVTVTLSGDVALDRPLAFPAPFASGTNTSLVIPMNEGISYPVTDTSIPEWRLVAYGGHGICMGFWGVEAADGRAQMTLLETPDDATLHLVRRDGRLMGAPEWDAEQGRLGYERKLRYVFFDQGGHVAMCKRYRTYAQEIGLFRTLADKRKAKPEIDKLIGAVNVWCWDRDPVGIVSNLQAAGITRVLWSDKASPDAIRALNQAGVLTSRYDIYQDTMDPAQFPKLQWVSPDWTSAGWPKDLMLGADGDWIRGWPVETKSGPMIPCGVLCDRQAPAYARERIAADLRDHPYRCRFIDTTTASPWRECYSPDHPMTRRDSRHFKMELLAVVSKTFGLVTGSETGHDASVPYVDYFEGMLSLGPYRVPEAGRDMARIWTEVPADVARFQMGHRYRLPLWELVYHDCVVAQWYWGDYNNKLPALWDKRDLFNQLYGTPPMFMFDRAQWAKERDRFVKSYAAVSRVARAVGYAEMIDHRFLTPDRDVQQTRFANGVTVTVNFGETARLLPGGTSLAAGGCEVTGIPVTPAALPQTSIISH